MHKVIFKIISAVFCFALVTSLAEVALAQNEDSDDSRITAEKAKHRKYPGGRDEQELTVQATLPQTSHYPEAPKAAVAPPAAAAGSEPESTD